MASTHHIGLILGGTGGPDRKFFKWGTDPHLGVYQVKRVMQKCRVQTVMQFTQM